MNVSEELEGEVDFDFFESPRKDLSERSEKGKRAVDKPLPSPKHGDTHGVTHKSDKYDSSKKGVHSSDSGSESYSDSYESDDSDSSPERNGKNKRAHVEQRNKTKNNNRSSQEYGGGVKSQEKERKDSYSGSSSAYSNGSSDEEEDTPRKPVQKKYIDVDLPKQKVRVEAWGSGKKESGSSQTRYDKERHYDRDDRDKRKESRPVDRDRHRERNHDRGSRRRNKSSDSDSDHSDHVKRDDRHKKHDSSERHDKYKSDRRYQQNGDHSRHSEAYSRYERVGSAKHRKSNSGEKDKHVSRQRSRSDSNHSNNSDRLTDVSPLDTPEPSPRHDPRERKPALENVPRRTVQYRNPLSDDDEDPVNGLLDSDKIDLSLLMKCMADIDKEKQQRLKANSRRVMFAPPRIVGTEKPKGNYSFSTTQAKLIERENQRLLKQIMQHVNPGSNKVKKPKPKPKPEVIQRLTTSAVNRQKEQRKIETENMKILKRLQTVKPTRGMSRDEQLTDFTKTVHYGIPKGAITPNPKHYATMSDTMSTTSMRSTASTVSMGTRRSRPSSAKSNASSSTIRSRPGSAKSNASTISRLSSASVRSKKLATNTRPPWNDRFSFNS